MHVKRATLEIVPMIPPHPSDMSTLHEICTITTSSLNPLCSLNMSTSGPSYHATVIGYRNLRLL